MFVFYGSLSVTGYFGIAFYFRFNTSPGPLLESPGSYWFREAVDLYAVFTLGSISAAISCLVFVSPR